MVNKTFTMHLPPFDLTFKYQGDKVRLTLTMNSTELHHTLAHFSDADSSRLADWIDGLEDSNYLNAPPVTFVTLDLAFEISFEDVDDEQATVTIFLCCENSDLTYRPYQGVRSRASRGELRRTAILLRK